MNKRIYLILSLVCVCLLSIGQNQNSKKLLIIDSIPFFDKPEDANQLMPEEIADSAFVTDKKSLLSLGWKEVDTITYLFTKEFRKRPDSVKRIPRFRQFISKDGSWHFAGSPYSGKFIDYYINGKRQREGTLRNGHLDGEIVVYFPNGFKQSVTSFESGLRHGLLKHYYRNGTLMRESEFSYGRLSRTGPSFFLNGKVQQEFRPRKATGYDTSITYYSTGKVRKQRIGKNSFPLDRDEEHLRYYTDRFYQSLTEGNFKEANKHFYEVWRIDSGSVDTYFEEGLLLAYEFRFDDAIVQFDKALAIEPLMQAAIVQRVLSRLKRNKFQGEAPALKGRREIPLVFEDFIRLSEGEKAKVCHDLFLLDALETDISYINKTILESILKQCKKTITPDISLQTQGNKMAQ